MKKTRKYKIQSLQSLREEMTAVARGDRPAPPDAARPSFNSTEALVRLLTPENRALLAIIRDRRPDSVAVLARLSGRAQPNLTRTLAKLEAAGLVTVVPSGRKRALRAPVSKLTVEINPYANEDTLEVA
jgi:predicted transcriptional regulator